MNILTKSNTKVWRGKYRRHVGLKQMTKQLNKEFSRMTLEQLLEVGQNLPSISTKWPKEITDLYTTIHAKHLAIHQS